MPRLAADENFNNDIIRGLLRQRPDLDLVRVQGAGLSGADDPTVLAWAAREERVLLTHDVRTLAGYAHTRAAAGQALPGVFEVSLAISIGMAIEDLLLLAECSNPGEWEGRVCYLPLR